MSITSLIPSVSTVLNAIKSITVDNWKLEEKDMEEDTVYRKQDITCIDGGNNVGCDPKGDIKNQEDLKESEEPEASERSQSSHDDSDYDPQTDEEQRIGDEEEYVEASDDTECAEKSGDFDTENEEELAHSDGLATEFTSAMDHILKIAKIERKQMLRNIKAEYKRETGEEATDGMIADAFDTFRMDGESAQTEQEQLKIDPEVFRKEFEEALCNVRAVAKVDQERLIDSICGISVELCGTIPDSEQISEIFGRIKDKLAAEAKEDFLAVNETTDDDVDENDYSPNDDPFDYSQDVEEDKFTSEQDEEEHSDGVVTEFTSAIDYILKIAQTEQDQLNIDPQVFRKEFEEALCNVRAVAKVDQERLIDSICGVSAELCGTIPDSKQISEIFGRIKDELAAEAKEDFLALNEATDDDVEDENDEDYSPNDDPFDYSQDVEEDKFESEQDQEEQE